MALLMEIVRIWTDTRKYSLTASLDGNELVLAGHDLSPGLEELFGRDEYEYWYRTDVAAVVAVLGEPILERVRDLLAAHGISASTIWKEWLIAHGIRYQFSNY
ncbi:MAG: hypothetical protein QM831_17295 [Kofleriaceae bacterium]